MEFSVGSLVKARDREWVVLPESEGKLLVLRPLGGTEDEITGVHLGLEPVESAVFSLPDPSLHGDHRSGRLLRDAVRLGFRSSAGPFRSFGRLGVEPRPYQLVPLLMALRLNPIRLLIADDAGIGKTVEAGLIARELIDRGEIERMAVLCPPHLTDQWVSELRGKFNIGAEAVLSGTVRGLEKRCRPGESLFEKYPYLVVSLDFIKSDRHRHEFLRLCPGLVIVDEAHTCAHTLERGRGRHQRFELVQAISKKEGQHLVLVTATPHSGNEEAFRSLLSFLKPEFGELPQDLAGDAGKPHRRKLAVHLVQRRRADIRLYASETTPFPERESLEQSYHLSEEYRQFMDRAIAYAMRSVRDAEGNARLHRLRWWSAVALFRSLASSPAAAAATLRTRAAAADASSVAEVDEIGQRVVLNSGEELLEGVDAVPGSDLGMEDEAGKKTHRSLLNLAREADKLHGAKDRKLGQAAQRVELLLGDGFSPIVFCSFIPTAKYVGEALRKKLKGVEVAVVTGELPPEERRERIDELAKSEKRVLVCTDCLSEGINLQHDFDAVFHYDLSWTPTRHEQREGRVDRYGQDKELVRVVTYYGVDNRIDGVVLDTLLRKHETIRSSLGVSVPVPADLNQVAEAIFEGVALREGRIQGGEQLRIDMPELLAPQTGAMMVEWERVSEKEKRSRTLFAQNTLDPGEVERELRESRRVVGSEIDVRAFVHDSVAASGGFATAEGEALSVDLEETPRALLEAVGRLPKRRFTFEPSSRDGEYLTRVHPFVEGLASYVLDAAFDPLQPGIARRAGVVVTKQIKEMTTLFLCRARFDLIATRRGRPSPSWPKTGWRWPSAARPPNRSGSRRPKPKRSSPQHPTETSTAP